MGLAPGDEIAVAAYGFDAYDARMAGLRVRAQVCDSATYADLDGHDPQASYRAREFLQLDSASQAPVWDA